MKKLIVSCDDLGITKEINLAIKDCANKGVITSSSIVANGEFYEHALNSIVNSIPIKFYGLHLNLTEGKALNKNSANILCNENNIFNISAKNFFLLNYYKSNKKLETTVYNELRSQIKKVLNSGIKLSHFDSHEHIHHSPWIFKIVTELGREFNINKIRFVNEKVLIKTYFRDIYYKIKSLNYLKHFMINICNKKIKNSFISPDYFFGMLNSGKVKIDELFAYLNSVNDDKTIEVCIHPANQEAKSEDTNKNFEQKDFYKDKNRNMEKNLLLSEKFRNFLNTNEIQMINFSDIN